MRWCPVCGVRVVPTLWRQETVVSFHVNPDLRDCWTSGLDLEFVKGAAKILSEDPRLPERAHP